MSLLFSVNLCRLSFSFISSSVVSLFLAELTCPIRKLASKCAPLVSVTAVPFSVLIEAGSLWWPSKKSLIRVRATLLVVMSLTKVCALDSGAVCVQQANERGTD